MTCLVIKSMYLVKHKMSFMTHDIDYLKKIILVSSVHPSMYICPVLFLTHKHLQCPARPMSRWDCLQVKEARRHPIFLSFQFPNDAPGLDYQLWG